MWNTTVREPKRKRFCNVRGCFATSKWQPDSVFFPTPVDPVRRKDWLNAINRNDIIGKTCTLYVCDKHFAFSDLINIHPRGKKLSPGAIPKLHLPLTAQNPCEKGAQVYPEFEETWVQTMASFRSDMVVQAGLSFTTQEKRRQKLAAELEKYQKHLKMIESDDLGYQMDLFHKSCDKFLSPQLSELIKAQTKSLLDNQDYRRNILPCMKFCLNLYHASPKAYRYLKDDLQLPKITTLKSMQIPISTEVNDDTISPLKLKVGSMDDTEKYCSVLMDVMPLKTLLSYNSEEDKIIGFHEIDGFQVPKPAQRAVVIVVQGILVDWTQPIGFLLISDTTSSQDISKWVDKILIKLLDIGLTVKAFVCTSKYRKNIDERNIRLVSVDRPFFFVNNAKIYYLYDTPYMFRQLRNIFLTHDMSFQDEDWCFLAKFQEIKEFYKLDKTRRLRIAPKLTNAHISPTQTEKRETKYATQLLSRSVAIGLSSYKNSGMIKSDFPPTRTVEFLILMNNMFDLLNASTSKTAFRGEPSQIDVFEEAIDFFNSLKLINSTTGVGMTSVPIFVEGFQINIKSILGLFEDLQVAGVNLKSSLYKTLITRRLNLEATENMIKKLKPKGTTPVTPRFIRRYRKLYLSYILKRPKTGTSTENLGELLSQLNEVSNNLGKSDLISTALVKYEKELPVQTLLEMAKTLEESSVYHLCGFLLRKCLDYHKNCDTLRDYVEAFELRYGLIDRIDAPTGVKPEPSIGEKFIDYVGLMNDVCRKSFDIIGFNSHIGSITYNTLNTHLASQAPLLCPCFPVEFLQKLFIRLRMFMLVHYNNSLYRMNRYKGKTFSFPSL